MGGGGMMRAAAKVAGVSVVNSGIRNVKSENPVSAAARKAVRPVSAYVNSSETLQSSADGKIDSASAQKPSWEIDDWEFAGGEEELALDSCEPRPRLVFGGPPNLQEAKEATSDLKDVIEKVYLSSPKATTYGGTYIANQGFVSSSFSTSEELQTKACVVCESADLAPVSKHAMQAFRFLSESPAAQDVVASIASDPNVWDAVWKNPSLQEFMIAQKATGGEESVADSSFSDQSPCKGEAVPSDAEKSLFENEFMDFLQGIKCKVVDMMSSLSDFFQNLFGASKVTDGTMGTSYTDKVMGASFMGLAVMAIMVIVLKRPPA